MECRLPVFYVDGQSMGNEQKTLPRRAKIVVAYKEKPNSAFQIRWEEIGDRTNNEAEYIALLKALGIIESKWGVTDVKLRQLCENVKGLMKKMSAVKLEWIPREENYAGQWLEDRWKGGKVEVVKDEEPGAPAAVTKV